MLQKIVRLLTFRDVAALNDNLVACRNITRLHSLKASMRGFIDIANEPGFVTVLIIQVITLVAAVTARVSLLRFQMMFFASIMVFVVEIINTAIEKAVDLVVGNQRLELARKAKDLAGLASLVTGLLWLFILVACLVG